MVKRMTLQEEMDFWNAITVIEARETLREISVACFPHSSKKGQDKLLKDLNRQAYPEAKASPNKVSNAELNKILLRGHM
jgi:hypothetical protein